MEDYRWSETETLLISANADIFLSKMTLDVEGFPPGIVYFVNEWVSHNTVADKLKRYKDKSFRRNKSDWLADTNKW